METLGSRIKIKRIQLGMSQEELARKVGYTSRSAVNKIELGKNDLTQPKIEIFATALGVSIAYLMGWEEDKPTNLFDIKNIIPLPKMKKVPLLGTIACGTPLLAVENLEGYINTPESIRADFALKCKGDSMINARIFDGDIVFIHQQPDVENGEIAAVIIEDEATLKKVYKYPEQHKIVLKAENPTFPSITYEKEELNEIRILGKATAFLSAVRG